MNHAGEIRTLVEISEPEYRVWTNVAEVHSEFFDSVEGIADAKAEILESATAETGLVANAADDRVMARITDFPGQVTTFGVGVEADVRATDVRSLGLARMVATVRTPEGVSVFRSSLLGEGNVANALAAIAVACRFQVPLDLVLSRLAAALLHESDVARNDPNPTVGHRLIAYDAGLPKSVIRFSTLHARTASVPCPAELRARRPSPMIDLYRKKTFSTRACRW